MERKIGEIFEYNGEWYQCIEDENKSCGQCDLSNFCPYNRDLADNVGNCSKNNRSDDKSIIFKKLEKAGEPYKLGEVLIQQYQGISPVVLPEDYSECSSIFRVISSINVIEIEIKQNKKDMEEKKLNLKPFDLEAAKAGKPVCTRDGRKARIICFDYNGETGDYPIVALVSYNKGNNCYERILKYTSDGLFNKYGDYKHDDDLMMLTEKKSGWINVYKERIYKTKDDAIRNIAPGTHFIDTIKVEWEE